MHISNFNAPPATSGSSVLAMADAPLATPAESPTGQGQAENADDRMATEIALLRARVAHLESVVDTARGLMSANQERLLRRLHDVPQELMLLTAKMTRFAAADTPLAPGPRPRLAPELTLTGD